MNMGAMFSSSANLSRILNSTEPLSVSEVHHSSTIEIDENGATAASATSKSCFIIVKVFDFIN